MMKNLLRGAAAAATMAVTGSAMAGAGGGVLLVPESTNDRVMAFNPFDGSLISMNYIDGSGQLSTPINAIQVGNEFWVSDQLADGVFRYDLNGTFLGQFNNSPLDNVRGIEFFNNRLYVSNSGSSNGAPGDGVVVYDMNGNQVDFWDNAGDPFDVLAVNGINGTDLLVNDIGTPDQIRGFTEGGVASTFFGGNSDFNFPEQMNQRANGNILVATFSSQSGIFEFDQDGAQVAFYNVGESGLRGVYELGNGNFMFTTGSGVFVYDPNTGFSSQIVDGVSARFIEFAPIPGPGAIALLGLGLAATGRRRRA